MKFSKIKKEATKSLSGSWGKAAIVTVSYLFVLYVLQISMQIFGTNPAINILLSTLNFIISAPLSYGLTICFIKLKQGKEVRCFSFLSEGFSNFFRAWSIYASILLKLVVQILLFVLIYILIYSSLYVYHNNIINLQIANFSIIYTLFNILFLICYLVVIIWALIKYLSYALAFNIAYINPNLSEFEILERSEKLMKNNKWKFVLFELSFIGWAIIAIIPFGIGLLWLIPYMQVATHCFYEYLEKNK